MHKSYPIPNNQRGATLIGVIASVVVLAALSAAMLSLYRNATIISTDANDVKMAYYMAESGLRYATSQLSIGSGSIAQKIGDMNSIPRFDVEDDKSFRVTAFTLGTFESINANHVPGNQQIALRNPSGDTFPPDFEVPTFGDSADDLYLVSSQDLGFVQALNNARVIDTTISGDGMTALLTVKDAIQPDIPGRLYFLAVQVTSGSQDLTEGGDLIVNEGAFIFPDDDGIMTINERDFTYEKKVDNEDGTYTLKNIRKPGNESWTGRIGNNDNDSIRNLGNGDFVILNTQSHQNVFLTATGFAGPDGKEAEVTLTANFYAGENTRAPKDSISFQDDTDFANFTVISSDPNKSPIVLDDSGLINLADMGASEYYAFGATWYAGDKHGVDLYCVDGKCDFGKGIRAFYALQFEEKQADGFVFTIMNGQNNNATDVGGDSAMGELLAFAGDSRVYNSTDGSFVHDGIKWWVDEGRDGIQPPKIGVEFDTYGNSGQPCLCYNNEDKKNDVNRQDPNGNHIAYVFSGDDVECADGFNCKMQSNVDGTLLPTPDGLLTYDDNMHGQGYNQSGGEAFTASNELQQWWNTTTTYRYAVRHEIHRSLRPDIEIGDPCYDGNYRYNLLTWVIRCDAGNNCDEYVDVAGHLADLTRDFAYYDDAYPYYKPVLEKTLCLPQNEHDAMRTILMGFTEGTGARTQVVTIGHYNIMFRTGADGEITSVPFTY